MENISFGAMVEYESSFDPHYEDEKETTEQDLFDLVDDNFDKEYEEDSEN